MVKKKGIYMIPKDEKSFTLYSCDGEIITKLYENSYAQELVDFTDIDNLAIQIAFNENKTELAIETLKKIDVVIGLLLESEFENTKDKDILKHFSKDFYDLRFMASYYAEYKTDKENLSEKVNRVLELDNSFLNTMYNEIWFYDFEDDSSFSEKLSHGYFFDRIKFYFDFILMQVIKTKPNICECFNCKGLFVAKTNRRANYCERVVLEVGKTCKQVGAKEREKLMQFNITGYREYKQALDRNYRRVTRAEKSTSNRELPKAIEYDAYCDWQKRAKKAFDDYLNEGISKDEFIAVIEELD